MNEVPELIIRRWGETLSNPSIRAWHSMAYMLASIWAKQVVDDPSNPLNSDLHLLSYIAHEHETMLMPESED